MDPTPEFIAEKLRLDPETGELFWKEQPGSDGKTRYWNARFAGEQAGSVTTAPSKKRYLQINTTRLRFYAHRAVWIATHGPIPDGMWVDHLDGDGLNNRPQNLRLVAPRDSSKNLRIGSNNTSGVTGVCWGRAAQRWLVYVGRTYIGRFHHFNDAVAARKVAEAEHGYHPNHGQQRPL